MKDAKDTKATIEQAAATTTYHLPPAPPSPTPSHRSQQPAGTQQQAPRPPYFYTGAHPTVTWSDTSSKYPAESSTSKYKYERPVRTTTSSSKLKGNVSDDDNFDDMQRAGKSYRYHDY
jgi:hypothetical protein